MRKTYVVVAAVAAVGVVVAGVLGTLGAIRFVQQQRSQSAYLLDISNRLARLEANSSSANSRIENGLSRIESGLSRFESDLTAHRAHLSNIEQLQEEAIAEIKTQAGRAHPHVECLPIAKLPARIERSGVYCLQNDLVYSLLRHEDAITVAADDVTIDLNGGMLRGHGTSDTISAGVYSAGYRNLVVSNGAISGFMWGIRYDRAPPERKGGGTVVFRGLIVRDSGFRGIYVDFGAAAETQGSVAVVDSTIDRVGGTIAVADPFAMGIELKNTKSCRIFGNRIVDVLPAGLGEGVGISFTRANGGCVAEQNYLLNSKRSEWGRTIGVWPGDEDKNPSFIFRNNVVYNYTYPFMHNSSVTVFADNLFHSTGCSPQNVRYYESYAALNRWVNEAAVCADHPDSFRAAAEAGDARAQFRLGTAFWEGVATAGSREQAWHWFGLAARNGLSAATAWINLQRDQHKRDPSWWIPQEYRD